MNKICISFGSTAFIANMSMWYSMGDISDTEYMCTGIVLSTLKSILYGRFYRIFIPNTLVRIFMTIKERDIGYLSYSVIPGAYIMLRGTDLQRYNIVDIWRKE